MDQLDQTRPAPLLTCPVCGRRTPPVPSTHSNDADPARTTPPLFCPSCGAPVIPMVTAAAEEPDRYQTAAVVDPPPPVPTVTSADYARTQPLDGPSALPEAVPGTKPSAGSRRNLWLAIASSLALVILLVVGILLSQSRGQPTSAEVTPVAVPTVTATPSLPAGFLRKSDANGLYSFAVPSNWVPKLPSSSSPTAEYTIYSDPLNNATFEIESFPSDLQGASTALDQKFLLNVQFLQSTDISQPTSVMLAGVAWIKETAQLPRTENGATQIQNLAVQSAVYNNTTYIIFYNSPEAGAGSQDGKVLLQILSTFNFTG